MAETTQAVRGGEAALVARAPDPEAARAGLRRYLAAAPAGVRQTVAGDPSLLEALLVIFGNSEFLTEALVQTPELVSRLDAARRENRGRARDEWTAALGAFTSGLPVAERTAGLARFKRREYLRIVLRDLQGLASLAETTQELSHLADAILEQAYAWAWNELVGRFGTPYTRDGAGAELAVVGLGKLGGEELNYNSDIDLMFLYSGPGETAGGVESTSNREFFTRLAQSIIRYVSAMNAEGVTYKVDLRLRPGGREGELALGLEPAIRYYRQEARDWELQMLIRARACAGARRLARGFLAAVEDKIYPARPDPRAVAEGVRLSRQRISAQLEHHRAIGRRGQGLDVKLDGGGIRDIEFLVQYQQRLRGGAEPWVRGGNTLKAMQRLHDKGWLGPGEFQRLSSGYWLLRQVEHRVQLRLGQQTHTLPSQAERLWSLARSLARAEGGRLAAAVGPRLSELAASTEEPAVLAGELRAELRGRMAEIQAIHQRYLGEMAVEGEAGEERAGTAEPLTRVRTLAPGRHGQRQLQRLLNSAATLPEDGRVLAGLSEAAAARVAMALEHSDWMAEALIRRPGLAAMLEPGAAVEGVAAGAEFGSGLGVLRRWRQQRTLQMLAEEWEAAAPIAATLAGYTELATAIIRAGLELARRVGPAAPSLAVLGMGRLGLGELDLLSDLDLVFVSEEADREAASKLSAKLIEALTAYTRDGNLYAVDTRLRPGGREGELVQTPASLAAYFGQEANAWEAFSYMKARWVAGDEGSGERSLAVVRRALRRRFSGGQIDRQEVAALRERMQEAGTPGRWGLKTPAGGYYDVDFLVSRLRLAAGTTALEPNGLMGAARALGSGDSGVMPAAEATVLADQVTLLRTADHALRAATGKAGSAIPASGEAVERAAAWLRRLRPAGEELETAVGAACEKIHAIYLRWR